jgi:hypothetical protein
MTKVRQADSLLKLGSSGEWAMTRRLRKAFISILLLATTIGCAEAASSTLVSLQTPRGARQAFILIKPDTPVASVILFAGGHGALGLRSDSTMRWGALNFLVRTRDSFVAQNLMVAVVDAPSDHQRGMNAIFRMGGIHAGDISAVAGYLKNQVNVPVWLVGTSMGTFSRTVAISHPPPMRTSSSIG